jgi:hypothetical protein
VQLFWQAASLAAEDQHHLTGLGQRRVPEQA